MSLLTDDEKLRRLAEASARHVGAIADLPGRLHDARRIDLVPVIESVHLMTSACLGCLAASTEENEKEHDLRPQGACSLRG
jgi:hypothetical protein